MKENGNTNVVNWSSPIETEEDPLTLAYAELGKAFYDYRFEEPTPELLLLFDRITEIKSRLSKQAEQTENRKTNHHIERIEPRDTGNVFINVGNRTAGIQGDARTSTPETEKSGSGNQTVLIPPAAADLSDDENVTVVIPDPMATTDKNPEEKLLTPPVNDGGGTIIDIGELPHIDPSDLAETANTPRYCPSCGNRISTEDVFCGNCGQRLKD